MCVESSILKNICRDCFCIGLACTKSNCPFAGHFSICSFSFAFPLFGSLNAFTLVKRLISDFITDCGFAFCNEASACNNSADNELVH